LGRRWYYHRRKTSRRCSKPRRWCKWLRLTPWLILEILSLHKWLEGNLLLCRLSTSEGWEILVIQILLVWCAKHIRIVEILLLWHFLFAFLALSS
jgi:hypothetical protein